MPTVDVPSDPSGNDQQGESASPSQDASNPNNQFRPLDRSNTFWARQTNAANWSLGRLTKEDAETMFALEEARNWGKMLKNCEKRRESLMKYSPTIRFMRDKITQMGGQISLKSFPCNYCVDMKSGGFNPEYGVELCANKLVSEDHQEETMAHEMVHVYDHLRFQVDWNDLRHAACSEIRASALSGECRFIQQFWRNGQWKVNKGYQDCVRRRAELSMASRPAVKDDVHAAQVVNEVWDSCLTDTRPFDEVYR